MDVPGEEGASAADRRRQAVEEKIARNKAALKNMKANVQALENEEYELLEVLNNTSQIISTLSPEILSEIFLFACADDLGTYRVPMQFKLGRICRAWRRMAWATPQLWCQVSICFSEKRYGTQSVLFEDWIKRSGNCPLILDLDTHFSSNKWEPSADSTFEFLMTTCHRWTEFKTNAFPNLAATLKTHRPQFPLLCTLDLKIGGTLRDRYLRNWDFFLATPQLRKLDLLLLIPGPYLGVNWGGLVEMRTTLSLQYRPSIEILALLPSLKYLHCCIEGYNANFNPNSVTTPDLRSLSSLSVNGHPKMVETLLNLITTPELSKLQINFYPIAAQVIWPNAIVALTQRSSCHLTELILTQSDITDEGLILDMLSKISPSLKEFCLYCPESYTMSNRTINRLNLALAKNQRRLQECLPNLETFIFRGNVSFTLRAMRHMLKSRRRDTGDISDSEDESNSEEEDDEEGASSYSDNGDEVDGNSITSTQSDNRSDSNSHTSGSNKFFMSVTYLNLTWYQKKNPNKIWDFTHTMADYSAKGATLRLVWEKPEDSDDDQES